MRRYGLRLAAAVWALVALLTVAPDRARAPHPVPALLFLAGEPSWAYDGPPDGEAGPEAEVAAEPEADPVAMLVAALRVCRPSLSEKQRRAIAEAIDRESAQHGYDPLFVLAMVEVESSCSLTARGEQGALGLVQMIPSTAREVAPRAGLRWRGDHMLTEPAASVELALQYLADLEERFRDPYLAMVAYNWGPARVGQMSRQRARGTQYVRKVMSRYEALLDRAAREPAASG